MLEVEVVRIASGDIARLERQTRCSPVIKLFNLNCVIAQIDSYRSDVVPVIRCTPLR